MIRSARVPFYSRLAALGLAAGLLWGQPAPVRDAFSSARPAVLPTGDSVLAGATVYEVLLDHLGRLWATTQEGVFRLEGGEWKPLALPPGMASVHVRAFLESADGALWVGTESSGLLRCLNGVWTVWNKNQGLPVNRVNHLVELPDASGRLEIWAATAGAGVLRFREGAWIPYGKAEGLADNWVWKLRNIRQEDGSLELWAATNAGISVFRNGTWKPLGPSPGQPTVKVNDLLQVQSGPGRTEIWASSWGRGLVRWKDQRWETFGPAQGFPSLNPTALALTPRPNASPLLWAASYDAGLASFDGKAWRHYLPGRDMPGTGVYALCANPAGRPTLWMGTRGLGLSGISLSGWRLLDERDGLPSPEVNCFTEFVAPNGQTSFWFGTSNGLLRWDGNGTKRLENARTGFPATRVNSLLAVPSSQGEPVVWAGTLGGLACQERGVWRLLGPRDGLPAAQAFGVLETQGEAGPILWAGLEVGLARREKGRWTVLTTRDGLPDNWVHALAKTRNRDGSTDLWVATRGGGVGRLRHGRWSVENAGLPTLEINTLLASTAKDGRQWLWAGSGGGGLVRREVDKPDAKWVTFELKSLPTLPTLFFYRLEMDRAGRLYASSPRGILRFQLEERDGVPTPVSAERFTLGDGLPNLSGVWFPSSFLDHLGRVWFGTPKGAVVLDPGSEMPVRPLQPPHLLAFNRGGEPLAFTPGMAFSQQQQREVFEFRLTSFHRPEDTRYRTQLMGSETAPGPWYPEGRRELTGLAPGKYVLKVWAKDYLDRTSEPLELAFSIQPPFWKRPWALALYALLAAGLLLALHRLRIYLLWERNRALERLVHCRTEELEASNGSLRALNAEHGAVIEDLRNTLTEVKTLRGLIPICMKCKKIRDYEGFWNQLESYLAKHSEARFSHGYCPECSQEARKELDAFMISHPGPVKEPD